MIITGVKMFLPLSSFIHYKCFNKLLIYLLMCLNKQKTNRKTPNKNEKSVYPRILMRIT